MSLEDFLDVHILIWTLINFILFTLVFKFLLLDPLLKVMRARREKIEKFDNECIKLQEEKEQLDLLRKEEAEKLALDAKEEAEKAYLSALERHRAEMERLEADNAELLKKAEAEIEAECEQILKAVDENLPSFTKAFTDKIINKGDGYVN